MAEGIPQRLVPVQPRHLPGKSVGIALRRGKQFRPMGPADLRCPLVRTIFAPTAPILWSDSSRCSAAVTAPCASSASLFK
jgi:hypothetical protein